LVIVATETGPCNKWSDCSEQSDLYQKIVAGAAPDAGVETRIEGWLHASADNSVALNFPEGEYLKGLVLRVGV